GRAARAVEQKSTISNRQSCRPELRGGAVRKEVWHAKSRHHHRHHYCHCYRHPAGRAAVHQRQQYRPQIQSELQQKLGRKVTLGNLHLRLLTPRVRVDNVTVSEDPRFSSGRPFAQTQELDVSIALLPLITGNVQVKSLTLQQPDIELVRNPQGVWNFSTIGQPPPGTTSQPKQPTPKPGSQQNAGGFELNNLQISDGQIAITDAQKHQPRTVYNHIDVSLSNFAPGRPFSVAATVHLPGPGTQVVSLDGTGGPINNSNMIATPF